MTHSQDDGRLLCETGRHVDVHFKVRWVVSKVWNANEGAVDSRNCCGKACKEGCRVAHS